MQVEFTQTITTVVEVPDVTDAKQAARVVMEAANETLKPSDHVEERYYIVSENLAADPNIGTVLGDQDLTGEPVKGNSWGMGEE